MTHIAIVEDEIDAQKKLLSLLEDYSREKNISIETETFSNGNAFLEAYKNQFDIVFLDIEMPHLSGMEVAKELRKIDKQVLLVFVTNLYQMAKEGYEVDALDFIVKPVNKASFQLKMERIMSRSQSNLSKSILIHMMDNQFSVIPTKDIFYVETSGHYIIYHTTGGLLKEYGTLKNAEKKIQDEISFVRCNRSYLVNLQYVERIDKDILFIKNDQLTISRPSYKSFMMALAKFIGG